MTRIKSAVSKLTKLFPALALFLGIQTLNSACLITFYQPEISSELDEYRK